MIASGIRDSLRCLRDTIQFKRKKTQKTDKRRRLESSFKCTEKERYRELLLKNVPSFLKGNLFGQRVAAPKALPDVEGVDLFAEMTRSSNHKLLYGPSTAPPVITLDDADADEISHVNGSASFLSEKESAVERSVASPLTIASITRKIEEEKQNAKMKEFEMSRKLSMSSLASSFSSSNPSKTVTRVPDSELPESTRKFKQQRSENADLLDGMFLQQLQRKSAALRRESERKIAAAEQIVDELQQPRNELCRIFRRLATGQIVRSPLNLDVLRSYYQPGLDDEEEEETEEEYIEHPSLKEIEGAIKARLQDKSRNETLIEAFDIPITKKDLETLDGLNWLNDEVINFYFNLIKERADANDNFAKIHIFSTFFYAKLSSQNNAFQTLKRWTRKVDLFSHDFILIPVHLGLHWTLISINCKERRLTFYDSMGGGKANSNGTAHLKLVLNYLKLEHQDKKKQPLPDDWQVNDEGYGDDDKELRIPQQQNGSDCGVFTCKFAEYLSRRSKFTFSQMNMPYFRRRMVYEILNKQLC